MRFENSVSFSKDSGFWEFLPQAKQPDCHLDYYHGCGAKALPVLPRCLSFTDAWASGFLSLSIGSLRERRLCLCEDLELTSISRLMPENYMVLFKRMSRKRESSELDAFPKQVSQEVIALMREIQNSRNSGQVYAYFGAIALLHRPQPVSLSFCSETFSPAVTTELNWGTANLIITMIVMAVIQKEKFRSHRTKWLSNV